MTKPLADRLLPIGPLCFLLAVGFATASFANDAARDLADRFATPPGETYEAELLERARREHRKQHQPPAVAAEPSGKAPRVAAPGDDPNARVDAILERLQQRIGDAERKTAASEPQDVPARPATPTKVTVTPPAIVQDQSKSQDLEPQDRRQLSGNDVFGTDGRERTSVRLPTAQPVTGSRPPVETGSLAARSAQRSGPIERVTVLLAIKPGKRGIRRLGKTGDPILCVGATCYISRGPDQAARSMRRGRAFGTVNTLGSRAGACRNSLACVFRDVRLAGGEATIQPIDLRLIRHDRRETTRVTADRTCRLSAKRLACAQPIISDTYTAWIVPEDIAVEAGVRTLETALLKRVRYAKPLEEAAARQQRR